MIEGKTVDGEAAEEQVVEDALAVEKKSGSGSGLRDWRLYSFLAESI